MHILLTIEHTSVHTNHRDSQKKKTCKDRKKSHNPPMSFVSSFRILITCQAGLESLVKRDTAAAGAQVTHTQDRLIFADCNTEALYRLLITSRYANRIYLLLATEKIQNFDELFSLVRNIPWKEHIRDRDTIVTEALSLKSVLTHTPTIQSITKKAIISRLLESTGQTHLIEHPNRHETHIQVFLLENTAHIALDITGTPLHKR